MAGVTFTTKLSETDHVLPMGIYVLIISECDSCRRTGLKKKSFPKHPHTGQRINQFFFLPQLCVALEWLFHDMSPLLRSYFMCSFVLFFWRIWFYFLACLVWEAESQLESLLEKRLTFVQCCISQQLKSKGVKEKYFPISPYCFI